MSKVSIVWVMLSSGPSLRRSAIAEILRAYRESGWTTRGAARILGVKRESTLYEWRRKIPELNSAIVSGQHKAGFRRGRR